MWSSCSINSLSHNKQNFAVTSCPFNIIIISTCDTFLSLLTNYCRGKSNMLTSKESRWSIQIVNIWKGKKIITKQKRSWKWFQKNREYIKQDRFVRKCFCKKKGQVCIIIARFNCRQTQIILYMTIMR